MNFKLLFFTGLMLIIGACGTKDSGNESVTPSGYKYEMYTHNDGPKPQPGEYAYFHAQTRNGDKVVNASRIEGGGTIPFLRITTERPPGQLVSPVQELLPLMSIGDSLTIYLPIDTLPEQQKPIGFKDADYMLYDMVLMDIKTAREFREGNSKVNKQNQEKAEAAKAKFPEIKALVESDLKAYKSGALDKQLVKTDTGLKIFFHKKTDGQMPPPGTYVRVHYYGSLMDGTMFDNSFQRGESIAFQLSKGQVISGWDEGIALLPEGSKATFFVPYDLAYGETGRPPSIPARADLVFYVELEKAN